MFVDALLLNLVNLDNRLVGLFMMYYYQTAAPENCAKSALKKTCRIAYPKLDSTFHLSLKKIDNSNSAVVCLQKCDILQIFIPLFA